MIIGLTCMFSKYCFNVHLLWLISPEMDIYEVKYFTIIYTYVCVRALLLQ